MYSWARVCVLHRKRENNPCVFVKNENMMKQEWYGRGFVRGSGFGSVIICEEGGEVHLKNLNGDKNTHKGEEQKNIIWVYGANTSAAVKKRGDYKVARHGDGGDGDETEGDCQLISSAKCTGKLSRTYTVINDEANGVPQVGHDSGSSTIILLNCRSNTRGVVRKTTTKHVTRQVERETYQSDHICLKW